VPVTGLGVAAAAVATVGGVAGCDTTTPTLLVVVLNPSEIVATNVYEPGCNAEAVTLLAALVPLALKVGAAAPLGMTVAAQV
jgi:hypothetical protein